MPESTTDWHHRGSGAVRTLVVASATLAILLVCFSIYQYSQVAPAPAQAPSPRVPLIPSRAPSNGALPPTGATDGNGSQGVSVGPATVAEGQRMKLSIFPREGTRSRLEIAVRDYTPIAESPNEFLLTEPEIRLRTNEGRTVRVRAREGVLDAQRQGAGGLDPRRGKLVGDVVIEIDRMTAAEWAVMPEEARRRIEEKRMNIVTVRVDEIDFDLEYAKVAVPRGVLTVSAYDIDFQAEGLELRFDEDQGQIEYLRIDRGGRLVLRQLDENLRMAIPTTDAHPESRISIVEWMQSALASALRAKSLVTEPKQPAAQAPSEAPANPQEADDEIPVFALDDGHEEKVKPPVRYLARFDGDVDAQQVVNKIVQARLQSDVLEIIRSLTQEEKKRVGGTTPAHGGAGTDREQVEPREEIRLSWSGKLVLEALHKSHERWEEDVDSRVTALGTPVRLSSPQWTARSAKLSFDPRRSEVWLTGSDQQPVVVFAPEQGALTGLELYTRRDGDNLITKVKGPGALYRVAAAAFAGAGDDPAKLGEPSVSFEDRMELTGRFESVTTVSLVEGSISTRECRRIQKADFHGNVRVNEGETHLGADEVVVQFEERATARRDSPTINQIVGNGNVIMTQGGDRLTCGNIDIKLTTDRDGKPVPVSATARNDIEALQQGKSLRARDEMVVEFATVTRPPKPFDPAKARAMAVAEGKDPLTIDWTAVRRAHEAKTETEVGVRHIVADGEVVVLDSVDGLDVRAQHVDCTLQDGREITAVTLVGTEERPAAAELPNFAVTGKEVRLNVLDEWASVPGAGRMTFRSFKDLDGRAVDEPIPISVTWQERMKYQGRENRAAFVGGVHATSASSTTFDCDRLVIDFEEKVAAASPSETQDDWWIFEDLIETVSGQDERSGPTITGREFTKEPVNIVATGHARVETVILADGTDERKGRALLVGPKLSVNLRPEVSKMLIEGEGTLLLEDFQEAQTDRATSDRQGGLFSVTQNSGPSKTVIEWHEFMWYDFSIDQTRFEGNVNLKHFSGAVLDSVLSGAQTAAATVGSSEGRETYLTCDVLTVDFFDSRERRRRPRERRMGGLSAERLRQFQATGAVRLQDETEKLSLLADRVVFERDRQILAIYGTPNRRAQISHRRKDGSRGTVSVERAFYNIETGELEAANATGWGQ